MRPSTSVQLGIDVLQAQEFRLLRGKRVGLLTNAAAADQQLRLTYQLFVQAARRGDFHLAAVFAPEHGFAASELDGRKIDSQVDQRSGVPIYSLYGQNFRPTADMLKDLDVLVCDLPDIGVRYYTYAWTAVHVLAAAGELGLPMVILDRPNPLGGDSVAGGGVAAGFESLVGLYSVPIRHGLTLGELLRYVNTRYLAQPADLTVIKCLGWERWMRWQDCNLIWIPTSPAMPNYATAQQYAGACLVEGTNFSEGRGTSLPFQIVGAPFADAENLADRLNAENWDGVRFRPYWFQPQSGKFSGEQCAGVQAHLVADRDFDPVRVWLGVLRHLRDAYPGKFAWREADDDHFYIDRLAGSAELRQSYDGGASEQEILAHWGTHSRAFEQERREVLLYA
ncbi:MAG: DUF1343 domain-containing protein [Anaerolineae bacterium]|nr:DUF1343 domain-containing protein [Anaerolineae bacterium]